jgi:hypothetical protein
VATQAERNARLDELATATSVWAAKRRAALQKQADFGKKLLKGRTGSERLNNSSVATASELVVDEIGQFLSGE